MDDVVRAGPRDGDSFDELAGLPVLLAIIEEIILQTHEAPPSCAAQHQSRIKGDQGGRTVADGRSIGDIAADRAGIAHLKAADAAGQLAKIGMQPREGLVRIGIAHARADTEAVRRFHDGLKVGYVADEDQRLQRPEALGHPKTHICRSRDEPRVGMLGEKIGQRRPRLRDEPAARTENAGDGLIARQRLQALDQRSVVPLQLRHRFARREDRTVTGAAAEIAP